MNQRKRKLFDVFMKQIIYCIEKQSDWFFYERPFLSVDVKKPEESKEELDKRMKYLAGELKKLTEI